jgi:hypothetical protein
MLKHFKINIDRDTLYPDLECYQMDLNGLVEAVFEKNLVTDKDFRELPSWTKFAMNPTKSKGFFVRTLKALFLGEGNHDELNADMQTNYTREGNRVAVMFLAKIRNENIKIVGQMAKEALPAYDILVLSGAMTYNGRKITNRNAESIVKEVIEKKNNVLIISAILAQRSFSIPKMAEVYLAFDRGEVGATTQKISRSLTPDGDNPNKVGRATSLSFDPNRDDKFDSMIIETALNYKKRNNIKSLQEALQDVLRTIDIYDCTPTGRKKIDVTSYYHAIMQRKGISRVLGKKADMSKLSDADIRALANGNANYIRNELVKITKSGKTGITSKKNMGTSKSTKKDIEKAREVIVTIIENLDIIIYGTRTRILMDALEKISKDADLQKCVEEEFGVPVETITYLFTKQVISQNWVELIHDNA